MANTNHLNTRIVLRNDTAAVWASKDPELMVGEIGVENDTGYFKIGQEGKTWSQLPYANKFDNVDLSTVTNSYQEVSAFENLVPGNAIGDIGIVKAEIATDKNGNKTYSHTCYVWDGDKWAAADGNYSAENVYLTSDITMAGDYTQIGNYTKGKTETKTLEVAGKSLSSILTDIFSKRLQPKITARPSASITCNNLPASKALYRYEVGATFTPKWSVAFEDGAYTYSNSTGVSPTSYTVYGQLQGAQVEGHTSTASSGEFPSLTVTDGFSYYVHATVNFGDGNIAKDNMGEDSNPVVQILAGSTSAQSLQIGYYRRPFWGYKTTDNALANPAGMDSTAAWALPNSAASSDGLPDTYDVPTGTKQIYFTAVKGAKPSTLNITDANALNAPVACSHTTIQVADKNKENLTDYDLWYVNLDGTFAKPGKLNLTWTNEA